MRFQICTFLCSHGQVEGVVTGLGFYLQSKRRFFTFIFLCHTWFPEPNQPLKIASYLNKEVRNKTKPNKKQLHLVAVFPPLEEMIEFHGADHPDGRILFAASR